MKTLTPGATYSLSLTSGLDEATRLDGHVPNATTANSGRILHAVKVFRVGTFEDSLGREGTWSARDLADMVKNFQVLRDRRIFFNVPVRADHSSSVNSIVGYLDGLSCDETFLYADVRLTEPEAIAKYDRGTYRSMSLEIGSYETNDKEVFAPTVLGLAFVDLPAVEGLYRKEEKSSKGEISVGIENDKGAERPVATFRVRGVKTTDVVSVQEYLDSLEAKNAELAENPPKHTFRIGGEDVSDFAKVQEHISALEAFRAEVTELGRDAFVDDLVSSNRVLASQADNLKKFAKGLSIEQYEAWRATFADAPPLGVLGAKVGGVTNPSGGGESDPHAIDREVVMNHRRAGLSDEQIAKTASYQRLKAAGEIE